MMAASMESAAAAVPAHVPADLVRDFDPYLSEGMNRDPYMVLSGMVGGPRIFWCVGGLKPPGAWFLTRIEDIRAVLQNPELFSVSEHLGFSRLIGDSWDMIPAELDPPRHAKMREWINPLFSPKRIRLIEDDAREWCVKLITDLQKQDRCEIIEAFAQPFPVTVFLRLMGLPEKEWPTFSAWVTRLLHDSDLPAQIAAAIEIKTYLLQVIEERRRNPKDDLVSAALRARVDGEPLTPDEVLGFCYLAFLGGIDTVASTLGFCFWHLAEHPDQQERLRAEPALIPTAVDELLRRFAIVNTMRRATQDTEIAGVTIKAGDWIWCPLTMASVDPEMAKDPLIVDFDREKRTVSAFSFGAHRCVGSHLARREINIAFEEWFKRMPPFSLQPGDRPRVHAGSVFGVDEMHLTWS